MTATEARREAAAGSTSDGQPSDGSLTHRQILLVFSGLMLGMFLAALDQMIVSTAIRTIARRPARPEPPGLGRPPRT